VSGLYAYVLKTSVRLSIAESDFPKMYSSIHAMLTLLSNATVYVKIR